MSEGSRSRARCACWLTRAHAGPAGLCFPAGHQLEQRRCAHSVDSGSKLRLMKSQRTIIRFSVMMTKGLFPESLLLHPGSMENGEEEAEHWSWGGLQQPASGLGKLSPQEARAAVDAVAKVTGRDGAPGLFSAQRMSTLPSSDFSPEVGAPPSCSRPHPFNTQLPR